MMSQLLLLLGVAAILSLLGLISILPGHVAFFVGSLAVVLFPGAFIVSGLATREAQDITLPGKIAIWFGAGIGFLAICAFVGLVLQVRLSVLAYVLCGVYASFTVALVASKGLRGRVRWQSARSIVKKRTVYTILLAIAIGTALLTLLSPRNSDDWYYLAYIRDFTADHALGSEDAIFGPTEIASPRIWYGAWWVTEALLSRVTGTDPVTTHQIYLPVLMIPFAVLAPIAIGLGLRFVGRAAGPAPLRLKCIYLLYCFTLLVSTLIRPLGIVWCALAVVPFALIESVRKRNRTALVTVILVIAPCIICGAYAAGGRGPVVDHLDTKKLPPVTG
jgi:hypothetical protein